MNINTPYSLSKDLGLEYNSVIERDPSEWVIVKDADVCQLTSSQFKQIPDYIEKFGGQAGIFTCYTNRIGYKWQRYKGIVNDDTDFFKHIQIAERLESQPLTVTQLPELISGFFMVIRKEAWRKVGGFKSGLLGVDDDFSKRVAKHYKIYRMNSIYLWHTYRLGKSYKDTSHL